MKRLVPLVELTTAVQRGDALVRKGRVSFKSGLLGAVIEWRGRVWTVTHVDVWMMTATLED